MDTLAVTYEAWVELSEEERKQISEEWLQTGEDKYKKGNLSNSRLPFLFVLC